MATGLVPLPGFGCLDHGTHFEPALCGADGVHLSELSSVTDLPSWSRGLQTKVTKGAEPQLIPNPAVARASDRFLGPGERSCMSRRTPEE